MAAFVSRGLLVHLVISISVPFVGRMHAGRGVGVAFHVHFFVVKETNDYFNLNTNDATPLPIFNKSRRFSKPAPASLTT